MKLLEEYAEGKSSWQLFFKSNTKSIGFTHMKEDKLDFVKIKIFWASKKTIKKVKKTTRRMGENIWNHIYDKGLYF